jgi:hypothetical protein
MIDRYSDVDIESDMYLLQICLRVPNGLLKGWWLGRGWVALYLDIQSV